LQSYVDGLTCSPGHRRGIIIACQRPFRWAYKLGRIDRFPLGGVEKPPAGKREVVLSDAEFKAILSFVQDSEFEDLLTVSRESGCRPQESLRVEARHVDVANSRWVFPASEAKGKKRIRVVYLTDNALQITKRLMLKHPIGPLFRNAAGDPFCACSINCCFCRIQIRMGKEAMLRQKIAVSDREIRKMIPQLKPLRNRGGEQVIKTPAELWHEAKRKLTNRLAAKHAPKYCLYNLRHTWMNRLLESGVDPITIATLAGHVDTSTLAKTYQHVSQNPTHLLKALRA
jgi:integrase